MAVYSFIRNYTQKDLILKKTTLLMIASASMLLAAPAVETNNAPAPTPQKGMFIMTQSQGGMGMMKNKCHGKMGSKMQMKQKGSCHCKMGKKGNMMQKKMMKQKMQMNSPFLIKHGLPHLTKMIMPYMNDPAFNLTSEQKFELAKVRKTTMKAVMEAKSKVMTLRREIVQASQAGVSSDKLKDKVAELALVEAAATMAHLKCIEATKDILTKDQMYFLLTNKNKMMNHGQKKMMGGKKGQPKMIMMKMNKPQGQKMKCAAGKCGQGMGK